jgi:hypothetical protein
MDADFMGLADDIDAWLGGAKKMWAGCSSLGSVISDVNTWLRSGMEGSGKYGKIWKNARTKR